MAALILGTNRAAPDTNALLKRITALKTNPRPDDPTWWNDLAGAHLRLGRTQEAANLLEPLLTRFPNDYGIHANLGTAYHLLGRYVEAEREIARDLELNTHAHFGLEVFHLALLQYLSRDKEYQSRHAYIDEFTPVLLKSEHIIRPYVENDLAGPHYAATPDEVAELKQALAAVSATNRYERGQYLLRLTLCDPPPAYRSKWNLAYHTNFEKGVRYMAELNSAQPSCFTMLGLACLKSGDLNLAALAFERAIELGSPQRQVLKDRIADIKEHIQRAGPKGPKLWLPIVAVLFFAVVILYVIFRVVARVLASFQRP